MQVRRWYFRGGRIQSTSVHKIGHSPIFAKQYEHACWKQVLGGLRLSTPNVIVLENQHNKKE